MKNPHFAILITFLSGILALALTKDRNYPKNYFKSPVDRAILLSGTFGELRSNHFHAGLDIKATNGKSGENVYASAEGYVSRIKVQSGGYGNALYIAHPNGYTTVYAHLDAFIDTLADYVKENQYKRRSFGVDLHPQQGQFTFDQGQLIGFLGNSGSSSGPHLHFEIRRSSSQVPINPLHFGIDVSDDSSPDIRALGVYLLDDKHNTLDARYFDIVRQGEGRYMLKDTIFVNAWRVAFALKTDDQISGTTNRNGIYSLETNIDSVDEFSFELEEIAFDESRYMNAHIDYSAKQNNRGYYHRCFKLPGNALNFYNEIGGKGIVPIYSNKARKISIKATDFKGNHSTLIFYIKRDTISSPPARAVCATYSDPQQALSINHEDVKANFPAGSFYSSECIDFIQKDLRGSRVFSIGDKAIPIHRYGTLSIRADNINPSFRDKYFIAKIEGNKPINYGGNWAGGWITTRTREFGDFTIAIDTIPPKITTVQFSSNMSGWEQFRIRITDETPTGGSTGEMQYEARVDGDWILMEYDAKSDMLTHRFDDRIAPGSHTLTLRVTDERGNVSVLTSEFVR